MGLIDGTLNKKTVYIFRENKELIISFNGKVKNAKLDYLSNQSILIDKGSESFLIMHGFYDTEVLAIKLDSSTSTFLYLLRNSSSNFHFCLDLKVTNVCVI